MLPDGFAPVLPAPDDIPDELLREANRCLPIRGRVRRDGVARYAIRDDAGDVVGFVCPHEGSRGWRLGPIYVTPSARGRGLARAVVLRFRYLGLTHYVPDTAPESLRMHLAIGFEVVREMKRGTWLRLPTVAP